MMAYPADKVFRPQHGKMLADRSARSDRQMSQEKSRSGFHKCSVHFAEERYGRRRIFLQRKTIPVGAIIRIESPAGVRLCERSCAHAAIPRILEAADGVHRIARIGGGAGPHGELACVARSLVFAAAGVPVERLVGRVEDVPVGAVVEAEEQAGLGAGFGSWLAVRRRASR